MTRPESGTGGCHGRARRHVGVELRPLGRRALPARHPPRDRLGHYVRRFDTVELNASFYRWPRDATFAELAPTPARRFRLSVKAPRGLTHAQAALRARSRGCSGSRPAGTSWATGGPSCSCSCRRTSSATTPGWTTSSSWLPDWMRTAVEFRHPSWHDEDRLRAAGAPRRGLLRHERRAPAVRAAGDRAVRLRAPARPRPRPPLRRLVRRRRPALVGRPDPRVERRRAATSSPTSTTTATATPSATPIRCGSCSTADGVPMASVAPLLSAVDGDQVRYGLDGLRDARSDAPAIAVP